MTSARQHVCPLRPRALPIRCIRAAALVVLCLALTMAAGCDQSGTSEASEGADNSHDTSTSPVAAQAKSSSPATGQREPLPPRPPERTYPPRPLNPPQTEIDRVPWMVVGETLANGSTVPTLTRTVDAPPLADVIPWYRAALYIGRQATIEGRIRDTGRASSGNIHFLNFVPNNRETFYIAVFSEAFEGLGDDPAGTLADQIIQVSGRITLYRGRPQIEVRDAEQITIFEAPTLDEPGNASDSDRPTDGATSESDEDAEVVPWDEAHEMRGRTLTVAGKVRQTNNIGNLCFVNFTEERDERLYVVIFAEAFDGFGGEPEKRLLNQRIEVTGEVVEHRGRPQIQVRDPDQIRIVED